MGLFSTKKKIYVASTVYNLAGDENLRPNVIQSVILGSVLSKNKISICDQLRSTLLNGPASQQRRFFDWAKTSYIYGMPTTVLEVDLPINVDRASAGMAPVFGLPANQRIRVLSAVVDRPDIHYWAEAWVKANYPLTPDESWGAEWLMETSQIVVYLNDVEATRIFAPADLIWGITGANRKLLYVSYQIETQDLQTKLTTNSEIRLYTYRMGSGYVAFDTMMVSQSIEPEFFPVIPMRLNKLSIRDPAYNAVFPNLKQGYKKLTGAKIDSLLDSIESNTNLGDVDSAYVVQGVSFNTKENAGREYIYKFLRNMLEKQNPYGTPINLKLTPAELAIVAKAEQWDKTHRVGNKYSDVFGTVPPTSYASAESFPKGLQITLQSPGLQQANFRIQWYYLTETENLGNAKTFDGNGSRGLAKVGEFWFHPGPDLVLPVVKKDDIFNTGLSVEQNRYSRVYLFNQYSKRRYRRLECVGLIHHNYIYEGHAATNDASAALADPEESGFIVPMHYPTLITMGGVKATQLATSCSYLVFNSYTIVKERWYERGIFKIILVIASVVLSIFTAGASLAAAGGILGANLAVGLAIGATAASAAIVGAVANALAAIVLTTIISEASVALFGEKIGAIIAAVVSIVAMKFGTQYANTGNFDVNWSDMLRADRLMELGSAVSKTYTDWVNADTAEMYAEAQSMLVGQEDKMAEVAKMSEEILGMTSGEINPMMLTDAKEYFGETSETFLSRTLMTGTDIAELTRAMIEDFAEISLELPKASPSPFV